MSNQQEQKRDPMFNSGKMEHIFAFDKQGKNAVYKAEFSSDEAREAMNKSNSWFYKIDGSCGMVRYNLDKDEQGSVIGWEIYQRFDDTKDKFKGVPPAGYINLPKGVNSDQYESQGKTHSYYLRLLKRPVLEEGKKLKGEDAFILPLYQRLEVMGLPKTGEFISVELVGKNFNNTPGVKGNDIAVHSHQKILFVDLAPKFEDPKDWLKDLFEFFTRVDGRVRCEGIVLEYKGRWWKVRAEHVWPIFSQEKMVKNYEEPMYLRPLPM